MVTQPEYFNAGGKMGLRGEAGAELILPQKYWSMLGQKTNNLSINISTSAIDREAEKRIYNSVYKAQKAAERDNL
jgi:hypothetical protein